MSINHHVVQVHQAAFELLAGSKQLYNCRKLVIFERHLDRLDRIEIDIAGEERNYTKQMHEEKKICNNDVWKPISELDWIGTLLASCYWHTDRFHCNFISCTDWRHWTAVCLQCKYISFKYTYVLYHIIQQVSSVYGLQLTFKIHNIL